MKNLIMHDSAEFYVSIVTFHEIMNGWLKFLNNAKQTSGVVRAYERLEYLMSQLSNANILPFGESAASIFDDLRASKIRVATMDLRIAAIGIANQMTLLTRNKVDFERVPHLAIQNWVG